MVDGDNTAPPSMSSPPPSIASSNHSRTRATSAGRISGPMMVSEIQAQFDPLDSYLTRCEPPGMPYAIMMPEFAEFTDEGDVIRIGIESFDQVRTIYMDLPSATEAGFSPLGYSVGRWEDATLTIETTGIRFPYSTFMGTPQSDQVEVVER
jgi:hypothetical protein